VAIWIRFSVPIACQYCIRWQSDLLASVADLTKLVINSATEMSARKPAKGSHNKDADRRFCHAEKRRHRSKMACSTNIGA
jgi:hypothetical protein